jgi:hypothetical protein
MSHTKKKTTLVTDTGEQLRPFGQFDKEGLKEVVGVDLAAREVQRESKERLSVLIVAAGQVARRSHRQFKDAARAAVCLTAREPPRARRAEGVLREFRNGLSNR